MTQIELPNTNAKFSVFLDNGEMANLRILLRSFAKYWTIDFFDSDGNFIMSDVPLLESENLTPQNKAFTDKYGIFFCRDNELDIPIEDALNERFILLWKAKNED